MNELTSLRLLSRNTVWNFLGQLVPFVVALITIPQLIQGLGIDRFGILILAWVVIGYFSLFDLVLGRALTQLVSKKLGIGQETQIPAIAWTCLVLVLIMGLLGTLVLWLICPWLTQKAIKFPKIYSLKSYIPFTSSHYLSLL